MGGAPWVGVGGSLPVGHWLVELMLTAKGAWLMLAVNQLLLG